jgi:predicted nucleic acid-binding protein
MYMNTSALHRPFDDLSSERVRLEAEAVAALFAALESGRVDLVASEYLAFEAAQSPNPENVERVRTLLQSARTWVKVSASVATRARELERFGLRGLDALHVASAEAGRAAVLVTVDDRMLRRCARAAGRISVRVVHPAEALAAIPKERES